MSHSKRNTSLAFFTSHERSLLKSHWGSQSTRLHRDSFLPFASCNLCLQPSISPVACASNGEVFCRECIVGNLLSQRKEIKRLEKEGLKRSEEERVREEEEEREGGERAVKEFERVMMGLEGKGKAKAKDKTRNGGGGREDAVETEREEGRGVKRKFQLDEESMLKNAQDERAKARKAIEDEKAAKPTLPSFWVPSLTPATGDDIRKLQSSAPPKLNPLCPASSPTNKHNISLKSLVTINFKEGTQQPATVAEGKGYICPACDKTLTNTLKAVMAIPCGHVLCKPCAGKFMSADSAPPDPHASPTDQQEPKVVCYVCEINLTGKEQRKKEIWEKKAEKGAPKAGTVELRSEGTGFAGGGGNMVKAHGTAFQC